MSDTSNTPNVEVNAEEATVEQTVLPSEPVEVEPTEAESDVDPDAGMRHE